MAEGLSGRKFANLIKHQSTAAESDVSTVYGNVAAGRYVSAGWVNLTDGDYGHLRVDADGYLLTRADTELTLSGVTIDNVKVFSTDGTAANSKYALVNASSIPYSIITNADASASAIPVAGNTVGVADIALPVADANVLAALAAAEVLWIDIKNAVELIDDAVYADSAAFTVGSSKGIALLGQYQATEDTAGDGEVGALHMTSDKHLKVQADGYDVATDSQKGFEVSPLNQGYVSETLATVTNFDGNPAVDTYYYVDMNGYRKAGFQFELDGGTAGNTMVITIEGTMQDDGTAAASCTYQDITNDVFGVASLSCAGGATANDMWVDNDEKLAAYHFVRIKVAADTTAGADDSDWTIYHKRLY